MADKPTSKRGRPSNPNRPQKVHPGFEPEMYACLEQLVELGYARSVTQVAEYLIVRGIDDLKRSGVLPKRVLGAAPPKAEERG